MDEEGGKSVRDSGVDKFIGNADTEREVHAFCNIFAVMSPFLKSKKRNCKSVTSITFVSRARHVDVRMA